MAISHCSTLTPCMITMCSFLLRLASLSALCCGGLPLDQSLISQGHGLSPFACYMLQLTLTTHGWTFLHVDVEMHACRLADVLKQHGISAEALLPPGTPFTPVLAIGSNASPEQLARKFPPDMFPDGVVIPVVQCVLKVGVVQDLRQHAEVHSDPVVVMPFSVVIHNLKAFRPQLVHHNSYEGYMLYRKVCCCCYLIAVPRAGTEQTLPVLCVRLCEKTFNVFSMGSAVEERRVTDVGGMRLINSTCTNL